MNPESLLPGPPGPGAARLPLLYGAALALPAVALAAWVFRHGAEAATPGERSLAAAAAFGALFSFVGVAAGWRYVAGALSALPARRARVFAAGVGLLTVPALTAIALPLSVLLRAPGVPAGARIAVLALTAALHALLLFAFACRTPYVAATSARVRTISGVAGAGILVAILAGFPIAIYPILLLAGGLEFAEAARRARTA